MSRFERISNKIVVLVLDQLHSVLRIYSEIMFQLYKVSIMIDEKYWSKPEFSRN